MSNAISLEDAFFAKTECEVFWVCGLTLVLRIAKRLVGHVVVNLVNEVVVVPG
jgi:hypothetical protein